MLLKNRLFTPGPTPLLPAAQTAMASFAMHHRTADFRALYTRVLSDMKQFIGTQNDVLVLASSGTGVMEGSVSNLTSPGDKVLVLTAGKFGERWRDLAKAFGCAVDVLSAPYGETLSLDEIRQKLTPDVARCLRAGDGKFYRRPARCEGDRETGAPRATRLCWSWTPSPGWVRLTLMWMAGASTSSSAARRRR
jgi:hypothetical protein